ncbi:MAG: hypothetical protein IJ861_09415 [Clostridia bacterium]|nr:hypothetical protein [Clostridia bacterium]
MNVCFNGYGENIVTFEAEGNITAGAPVMVSGSGMVKAASGVFCGICTGVRNGYAAVQLDGFVRVPYGTAPSAVGFAKLTASGGKVSTSDSGREYLVVDIDTAGKTIGIIL